MLLYHIHLLEEETISMVLPTSLLRLHNNVQPTYFVATLHIGRWGE